MLVFRWFRLLHGEVAIHSGWRAWRRCQYVLLLKVAENWIFTPRNDGKLAKRIDGGISGHYDGKLECVSIYHAECVRFV